MRLLTYLSVLVFVLCILPVTVTSAMPEYSVQNSMSCAKCHYDENGGGMRNSFGAEFLNKTASENSEVQNIYDKTVTTEITEGLRYGIDYRPQYYQIWKNTDSPDKNSFITRQAKIHIALQPSEKIFIILENNLNEGYGAFVKFNKVISILNIKAGRFIAGNNLQRADHNSIIPIFTRKSDVFSHRAYEDGVQIGIGNDKSYTGVLITNGAFAGDVDYNGSKSFTFTTSRNLTIGRNALAIGGYYRYSELGKDDGPFVRIGGIHYGISKGKFTFLGESFLVMIRSQGYLISHTLRYNIANGWQISVDHQQYQPEFDNNGFLATRVKISLDYKPYNYLSVSPSFEYQDDFSDNFLITEILLHLWF